jgi:glycosyltransferase involved in cell wall biosynthesis
MKISIIIPVYNTEEYIERCIQSVLNQTLQDFEVILVNDATQDNSMAVIKKYADEDSRFIIVENKQNMGSMWTRREGYKRASGDYFVFCDSDDYLPENALEVLYTAILTEKADIISGAVQRVMPKRKGGTFKNRLSYGTDSIAVYKSLLEFELLHSLCGKIYNRKLFDDNDYETFIHHVNGTDAVLFYQLVSKIQKMQVIDTVVYYYYLNYNSVSFKLSVNRFEQALFSINYNYTMLNDKSELDYFLIRNIISKIKSLFKIGILNKKFIITRLTIPSVKTYFYFKTISQYYSGWQCLNTYMLMNWSAMRYVYHILRRFWHYLSYLLQGDK